MKERGTSQTCVFCGRAVEPGEPAAGRGDSLAHAQCADRALADDDHWNRIADQFGDRQRPEEEASPQPASASRSGCLALAMLLVAVLGLAAVTLS